MASENPFTMIYDALWRLPLEHPDFAAMVPAGNRIKYNTRDPHKQDISTADVPELVLTSETVLCRLHNTSSTTRIDRQFSWLIATGDFRIKDFLLQVEWQLVLGMLRWKEILGALTWKDYHFAKRCDITSVSDGFSDAARNRGIQGWSAIWRCEVECHFPTKHLLEDLISSSSSSSGG